MRTQYITSIGLFYKNMGRLRSVSDCEELVGEVNHTTECVTDLFIFWDILFTTQSFEFYDYYNLRHIDSFHQLLFP